MQPVKHVLDNPIWNALISGNKEFAQGTDTVKFFPREVAPFVAFEDNTVPDFDALYNKIPFDTPFVVCTLKELNVPDSWSILMLVPGFQMVYNGAPMPLIHEEEIVSLTEEHVQQMLALTKLTNPG